MAYCASYRVELLFVPEGPWASGLAAGGLALPF